MGMLDSELVFSDAQAAAGLAVGDNPSTNYYNCGQASSDTALTSENLWVNVTVNTAITSAGNATIQAVLQDSADAVNFADAQVGPVVPVANATQGTALLQVQPQPGLRQYTRIVYRIAVAALTGGAFDAFISNTIQRNVAKPSGFTVK